MMELVLLATQEIIPVSSIETLSITRKLRPYMYWPLARFDVCFEIGTGPLGSTLTLLLDDE